MPCDLCSVYIEKIFLIEYFCNLQCMCAIFSVCIENVNRLKILPFHD